LEPALRPLSPIAASALEGVLDQCRLGLLDEPEQLVRELPVTLGPERLRSGRQAVPSPGSAPAGALVAMGDQALFVQGS